MPSLYSNFLFFIGNSGAGKDTCMEIFWKILNENGIQTTNLKRYITRPSHLSEDFISIDTSKFKEMAKNDEFAFYWKIYDNYYGYLKSEIETCIQNDVVVLFNISRSLTTAVSQKYPGCRFVQVTAPKEVSSKRVVKRKRSTNKNIQKRIERMERDFDLPNERIVIDNSGTLDDLYNRIKYLVNELFLTSLTV